MKVKLLQHIPEGNGIKRADRKNRDWTPPRIEDGKLVESNQSEKKMIAYVAGAIIEMSDASAKKWIDRGWAEPYVEQIEEENKDG